MANFRVAKRDALSDTRTNIFDLHEKRLEYFESEKNHLPTYYEQLKYSKNKILKTVDLDEKYTLNKNIEELTKKISLIENDQELNDYLLDFFSIVNSFSDKNCLYEDNSQKGIMDSFVNSSINTTKTEMYNEYIKQFNPELKNISLNKTGEKRSCKSCQSDKINYDLKTSNEICNNCGVTNYILFNEETNTVSFHENLEQVVVFNYKRNNHFQECLNQLQAKENTTIPPIIIQRLAEEFKKYNINDPKLFTPRLVKVYLRKLEYNKYYEHIPTIINEFCGLPAPRLTPELEQQLKIMFDEIQIPFEKYRLQICPTRKNFLNYNYIFYKMCELLNKDEFLTCFPLLKSREKLYEHDLIWKGICNDLRWQFIPSI
jgi:hypothetical protein